MTFRKFDIDGFETFKPTCLLQVGDRAFDVRHGAFHVGDDLSLQRGRQAACSNGTSATVNASAIRRPFVAFYTTGEHKVAGQIRVSAAKSMQHPRPEACSEFASGGENMNASFIVCGKCSVATAHETKMICDLLQMRKEIADLQARLPAL